LADIVVYGEKVPKMGASFHTIVVLMSHILE
jgi:hypothetical protein